MADLHEVHTCKDCGAVITLPYAKPVHTHGPHTGPGIECPELVVGNCRVMEPGNYVRLTPEATARDDIAHSEHWQQRDAKDGGHSDR